MNIRYLLVWGWKVFQKSGSFLNQRGRVILQNMPPWMKALAFSLVFTLSFSVILISPALAMMERNIAEAENQQVRQEIQTVIGFIEYKQNSLFSIIGDYSNWDETYQFAISQNRTYIENNLSDDTFISLDINLLSILDRSGEVVYSKFYDPQNLEHPLAETDVEKIIQTYPELIAKTYQDGGITGLVQTGNGVMIMAAKPILTSKNQGPAQGILIFGQLLDRARIEQFSQILHKSVSLLESDQSPPFLNNPAVTDIAEGEKGFIRVLDTDRIAGYFYLNDLRQEPIALLEVQMPRPLYQQGLVNQRLLLTTYARSIFLFFLALFLLLLLYFRSRQTELKTFSQLKESQERYELATAGSSDGIWDWDLVTNRVYYSERWKKQIGIPKEEAANQPKTWLNRIHPDDRQPFETALLKHLRRQTDYFECEYRIQCQDGSFRWMLARGQALWDKNHYAVRIAGSQTDITDTKKREAQLRHGALYDPLTNLPNRSLFEDRFNHALGRNARRGEVNIGLIYLNINRFKHINENFGYAIGDQILVEIARRIQRCIRNTTDTPSRLVGDEFMIVLEDIREVAEVKAVAQRMQDELSRPFLIQELTIHLTSSVIIYKPDQSTKSLDDILQDIVLVSNTLRISGKNSLVILSDDLLAKTRYQITLENELRLAATRQEFVLYYQPIYSLENDRISRLEALLRWNHPKRGLLPPSEFIPLLESTGLILQVGLWVIRTACRQVKTWQETSPYAQSLILNINLSALQFADPQFPDQIDQILKEIGFPAQQLCLEITETVLMENLESASRTLTRLKEMGIHIEIDDFGTGYSSLSYLKTLPVDGIKIDRSFISNLETGSNEKEIVRTLLDLANTLGLYGIAEGVETARQRDILKDLKCAYSQGYFYSKPVEWDALEGLVKKHTSRLNLPVKMQQTQS